VLWEVFRQERAGQPFQHGGSLEAPNLAFAEAYAREFYGRRNESVTLWIVARDAIHEVQEPYVADVFDRDYRRVDGYSIKVKLKEARERAGAARPGG
jgi:ring-1,2-phenylacetyl-CoA epoxidase subunit PaaB